MSDGPGELRRVIGNLRRRAMIVRMGECVGMGIGAGAGVVLLILAMHPGIFEVGICLAVGAVAGGIWGIARRPTALSIAIEADQQMRSGELLSTAWIVSHVRRPSAVDMEDVVVAMAEARCRESNGREIAVARLSSRAWAGIGLLAVFSVTISLLASNWGVAAEGKGNPDSVTVAQGDRMGMNSGGAIERGRPGGESPVDTDRSFGNPPAAVDALSVAGNGGKKNGNGPDGMAGDFGKSDVGIQSSPLVLSATGGNVGDQGVPAAGVGKPSGGTVNSDAGGSMGAAAMPSADIAPWDSTGWPAAAGAAQAEIRSGRIDPQYQELVRDYFIPTEHR